jgi:hypothetical protein
MKHKVFKALVLNLPKQGKWYHGYLVEEDDLRGQEIIVAEHGNKAFSNSYSYSPNKQYCSSSLFVSKEHIHIIEEVGEKNIFGSIEYFNK